MKRSEMIQRLYAELEMLEFNGGHDLADKVLNIIENAGMLPPQPADYIFTGEACYNWEPEEPTNEN